MAFFIPVQRYGLSLKSKFQVFFASGIYFHFWFAYQHIVFKVMVVFDCFAPFISRCFVDLPPIKFLPEKIKKLIKSLFTILWENLQSHALLSPLIFQLRRSFLATSLPFAVLVQIASLSKPFTKNSAPRQKNEAAIFYCCHFIYLLLNLAAFPGAKKLADWFNLPLNEK